MSRHLLCSRALSEQSRRAREAVRCFDQQALIAACSDRQEADASLAPAQHPVAATPPPTALKHCLASPAPLAAGHPNPPGCSGLCRIMNGCKKVLTALSDCQRKHPHESSYVCAHLQRAAGWCLFRQACPDEGGQGYRGCCTWHSHLLVPQPWALPTGCPRPSARRVACCYAACHECTPSRPCLFPPASRPTSLLLLLLLLLPLLLQWMLSRPALAPAADGPPLQGRQPSLAGATRRLVGLGLIRVCVGVWRLGAALPAAKCTCHVDCR